MLAVGFLQMNMVARHEMEQASRIPGSRSVSPTVNNDSPSFDLSLFDQIHENLFR